MTPASLQYDLQHLLHKHSLWLHYPMTNKTIDFYITVQPRGTGPFPEFKFITKQTCPIKAQEEVFVFLRANINTVLLYYNMKPIE